jgi:hypothetical protein
VSYPPRVSHSSALIFVPSTYAHSADAMPTDARSSTTTSEPLLGTLPSEGAAPPNRSSRMLVNESALPLGVATHVAVALDSLNGS